MECKNDCGSELTGRQERFCSDKCRKQSLRAATARLNSDITRTANSDTTRTNANSDNEVGQEKDTPMASGKAKFIADIHQAVGRPPCTLDQLTSSCLTCIDKPTCSYLHNQNSAVPGDADYAGVI